MHSSPQGPVHFNIGLQALAHFLFDVAASQTKILLMLNFLITSVVY